MPFIRKNNPGFSFIELIIVVSILSVVSLAIYATFNNGMKIWQRVNRQLPEEELDIFFEEFTRDLRNCLKFAVIGFLGREDRLEFATLTGSAGLKGRTVGQVSYLYEPAREMLIRRQRDYSQVYSDAEGKAEDGVRNIKSVRFKYYFYSKEKNEYYWQEESLTGAIPLAVRIELELEDEKQLSKFARTVTIPIGG